MRTRFEIVSPAGRPSVGDDGDPAPDALSKRSRRSCRRSSASDQEDLAVPCSERAAAIHVLGSTPPRSQISVNLPNDDEPASALRHSTAAVLPQLNPLVHLATPTADRTLWSRGQRAASAGANCCYWVAPLRRATRLPKTLESVANVVGRLKMRVMPAMPRGDARQVPGAT